MVSRLEILVSRLPKILISPKNYFDFTWKVKNYYAYNGLSFQLLHHENYLILIKLFDLKIRI